MLRTFAAAQRAHAQKLRKEAERDPLVAAVLEKFPGAEVVAVREVLNSSSGVREGDASE